MYIVYIVYNDGTATEYYASSEHVARLKAIFTKRGKDSTRVHKAIVLDEYNHVLWAV